MHKSAIFVEIRGGVGDEPVSPFLPYCFAHYFKLVTSIETKIVSWPILVFSINLMKSVVSFYRIVVFER